MISNEGLLYIEPTQQASTEPVLDHLTRKMAAAFRGARRSEWAWCGVHECVCGALSTSSDYRLPNGEVTNALCVHYVAHHRCEVPSDQLARVGAFAFGEVEPTAEVSQGPSLVLARVRTAVEDELGAHRLSTWTHWGLDVEGLSRCLRGGRLPAMQGLSPTRRDAGDLLSLICSIPADSLSYVKTVVEQDHGDVRRWGQQALRIPGWGRGLWVSLLLALLQWCKGMERRSVATNLQLLGPAAAAAWPTLLELAKREGNDRDYQHDLSLALSDVGTILGVPLRALPGNLFGRCPNPQCRSRRGWDGRVCGYCGATIASETHPGGAEGEGSTGRGGK
jgi:hypothetical protein